MTNPVLAYGHWLAEAADEWPAAAIETAQRAFIEKWTPRIAGTSSAHQRPDRIARTT